jgi:hypothetical protein
MVTTSAWEFLGLQLQEWKLPFDYGNNWQHTFGTQPIMTLRLRRRLMQFRSYMPPGNSRRSGPSYSVHPAAFSRSRTACQRDTSLDSRTSLQKMLKEYTSTPVRRATYFRRCTKATTIQSVDVSKRSCSHYFVEHTYCSGFRTPPDRVRR